MIEMPINRRGPLRRLIAYPMLLALCTLPFACGSSSEDDCIDLCEQTKSCSSLAGIAGGDCSSQCAQLENVVDSADCHDAYEKFLSCGLDASDVCQIDQACAADGSGYALCILTYCNAHPDDCKGIYCSYGSGGPAPNCTVDADCGGPHYSMSCDGTQCVCSTDGTVTATLAYDAGLCVEDLDAQVAAAVSACGWSL